MSRSFGKNVKRGIASTKAVEVLPGSHSFNRIMSQSGEFT